MFDGLIDNLQKRFGPDFKRGLDRADEVCSRIVSLLAEIRDNTDSPSFQSARYPIYVNLNAGNGRTRVVDIPQFQDWELDYVAVVPTAASNVIVRAGGFLIYANNFANPMTQADIGAIVKGGNQLVITSSVDTEVTLIFVAEVPDKPQGKVNPRAVGEEQFAGLQGTEGGAEPERHLAVGLGMTADGTRDIIGHNNQR